MSTGPAELLESPPTRSSTPWIVVAVLAVLALIGWNVLGPAPDPAAPIAIEVSPSPEPEPPPEPAVDPASANYVSDLSFVDDTTGFAILNVCTGVDSQRADHPCPRRLLATTDAGASWETRGHIPILGGPFDAFVPLSDLDVTIVDQTDAARMLRSADGGWSWATVAISSAPPAAVSIDAVLQPSYLVACRESCEPAIRWIDPATQRLHELPGLPSATGTVALEPWHAPDGDIVVSGGDLTAAYLAMSTDGGQTWTESRLGEYLTVQGIRVLPTGAGRAYAYVYAGDPSGAPIPPEVYRTDDGGTSWVDIAADQPVPDWNVDATIDGELIGVSGNGVLLVSSNGGTEWTELPNAPAVGYVRTSTDGRVLSGHPLGQPLTDRWAPYLSFDGGRTWTRTMYPIDGGG